MSERIGYQSSENEYALATANLFDKATLHMAFSYSAEDHANLAEKSGYSGIELWPTRPLLSAQIRTGILSEDVRSKITSTHQSFRTQSLKDVVKSPGALQPVLILPEEVASLAHMEKVHKLVGDIPTVMYKETPQSFHDKTDISRRLIQPDPETAKAWDIQSTQDYIQQVQEHGFTGVCLDTTHLRRLHPDHQYRSPLASWEESVPELLDSGLVKELHVAVGRTDAYTLPLIGKETTLAELKDLVKGTTTTDSTRMLHMIAESGWKGLVVVEMLPSALKEIIGHGGKFMSAKTLQTSYEQIRESLYRIFDK